MGSWVPKQSLETQHHKTLQLSSTSALNRAVEDP
jgi:hypothetical protein